MEYLHVTYRINTPVESAGAFVESIMLEQSVETPRIVAEQYEFVRERVLGRVREVAAISPTEVRAVLDLPAVTASTDVSQLLNVLFGNVSLHESVRLEHFELPPEVLSLYPGPRFGIEGIRRKLGVHGRALTCSALKPVGLPPEALAGICRTFAEGGIDIIKDDHYLAGHAFSPFEDRVQRCQHVVDEVSAMRGRRSLYCPNLSGTPDDVKRALDFAQRSGVQCVMIAPMLLGLAAFFEIARDHLEVPVLLHPSFAGASRIGPEVLLGQLFRLLGGDAVIFPSFGGRFSYRRDTCRDVTDRLRARWDSIEASLPVPAGGMTVERTPELIDFYGTDAMLLVGGSLLVAGESLLDRTRAFTEAVAAHEASRGAESTAEK